jgi:hypothetical protein
MYTKRVVNKSAISSSVFRQLRAKKYQGKCVGLANGRIVAADKSVSVVIKRLSADYKGQRLSLLTVPKKNKVLIL